MSRKVDQVVRHLDYVLEGPDSNFAGYSLSSLGLFVVFLIHPNKFLDNFLN
jgi:hypothetical protein